MSLTPLLALGTLSFLLGCLIQPQCEDLYLVVFHLVMTCLLISLGGLLFCEVKLRNNGSGEEKEGTLG